MATGHRDRRTGRDGHSGGKRHATGARGFTLLEMTIATAIFGLLASGAILATTSWLQKQSLDRTNKTLDKIESALTLFVVQRGHLPCPYDPAAAAPGTYVDGNCTVGQQHVGVLPYRDMGLQRTDAIDGWNRYITYAVDTAWTANPADVNPPTPFLSGGNLTTLAGLAASSPPTGGTTGADALLDVRDSDSEGGAEDVCKPPASPAGTRAAVCAAYVLVSHGEDGSGAFIAFTGGGQTATPAGARAEAENADGDEVFAAEAFTAAPSDTQFRHFVRFRTPAQILRDALQ